MEDINIDEIIENLTEEQRMFFAALGELQENEKHLNTNIKSFEMILNRLEKENKINNEIDLYEITKNIKNIKIEQKDKQLIKCYFKIIFAAIFITVHDIHDKFDTIKKHSIKNRLINELHSLMTNIFQSYKNINKLMEKDSMTTDDLENIATNIKKTIDSVKLFICKINNYSKYIKEKLEDINDMKFLYEMWSQLLLTKLLYL